MVRIPDSLIIEKPDLVVCLGSVELAVSTIWKRPILQNYTDHSIEHSERIIQTLGKLLEKYGSQLNEYERFILLASAYLHDIGMQSPVHAGLEKKDRYSEEEESQIRDMHNESSAKMISDAQMNLGLENCSRVVSAISQVCLYHRHFALNELKDDSIAGEKIRIPLLVGLLRLGDELDADYRRVFMNILKTKDISLASKYHWWAHHYVRSVDIEDGKITLHFEFPLKYKNNNIIEALREKVKSSVNGQFLEVYDLFYSCGLHLYREIICIEDYSDTGLEDVPEDLEQYIVENVTGLKETTEKLSMKAGANFWLNGVPYSDDIKVVECLNKLVILITKGKILEAIKAIEHCKGLTMGPKERIIFYNSAGFAYFISGDNLKSKFYFDEVLAIAQRNDLRAILKVESKIAESCALGNIGLICKRKGDLDQALKYHQDSLEASEKAIEFDPKNVLAWVYKGTALGMLGRYEEALKAFDRAIELDPNYTTAWINKGTALGKLCRYEESLKALDRAIELDPEDALARANKAGALGELNRPKEALEESEKAIKLDPRNATAWASKGAALHELGIRYEESLEASEMAIELDSGVAQFWINKCAALSELIRYEESLEALERAIVLEPKNASAWANKGIILRMLGRLPESLEASDEAIMLEPKNASAWINKGIILKMLGFFSD